MADPNQEVTPEQIEIMRAYGEALRTPQRVGHPAMGIANLLGALAGGANIQQAERLRLQQIRRAFPPASVVPSAAPQAPPVGGISLPNAPQRQSNIGHDYVDRVVQIESGGDPSARTGRNRGLGQFSPDLERRYGITDWTNPDQQRAAIAAHAQDNANVFRSRFGREPTQGELYLMHQQGVAGAPALLENPNISAVDALVPAYNGNRVLAESAVRGNLPPNLRNRFRTITAGEFANFWTSRFDGNRGISSPTQNEALAASSQILPRRVRTIPIDNTGMMRAGVGNELPQGPQLPPEADLSAPRPGGPPVAGNLPGTLPPAAPETPPVATPASGTPQQQQLPAGVPDRIAPNAALPLLEQQVRNITSMPPEQRQQLYQNYQAALQPIQRETAAGVSHYDPRTGQHLYTVPKLLQRPISVSPGGGVTTQENMLLGPGRTQIIPSGPLNSGQSPSGAGASSSGAGERTEYGIQRNFPQGGQIGDYMQFGQEAGAATKLVEAQTGAITSAIAAGPTAARQINLFNTMLAASRRGGFIRGQPAATVVQQARTIISNLNPILPEGLRVNTQGLANADVVTKLNGQLAFLASTAMANRGTNLDLQTAMSTIPGLNNSQAALEMLVDILKQEAQAQIRLSRRAQGLSPNQIPTWARIQEDEYTNHPIELRLPDGRKVTTRPINSPSDADALPSGTWFIDPTGTIRQRP